jgi:hypothetical protein
VETLEARVEHLEAELEGLQDAVYRQAVLEDEHIGELRKRTAPEQLARDLSEDARRRGCDGRFAADRGAAGRGSLPPRAL